MRPQPSDTITTHREYRKDWRRRYDFQILHLLDVEGLVPKEVALRLGISLWSVYRASASSYKSDPVKIRAKGSKRHLVCKCGKEPEWFDSAMCKGCHAEYMRKHRKPYGEMTELEKMKALTRSKTKVYVSRGKIKKASCRVCGDEKSQAHHVDYKDPFAVVWLCRKHHERIHRKMKHSRQK